MENRSMHRSSEPPRSSAHPAGEARAVDQQRDAPDALDRERRRSERMRMPHERDESPAHSTGGATPAQDEVIGQAAEDLARGLRDTDCRGQSDAADTPCPPRASAAQPRMRARGVGSAAPARLGRAARRMRRAGTRAERP
jgi:hypothetical protein